MLPPLNKSNKISILEKQRIPPNSNAGFSLVELSIVLVILGLLVGGIMTGQNLIRAAELRSVTTEFQTYQTAVNLFKEKYFALPGDMRNATQFWVDEGNCAAVEANTHTIALSGGTCNGDGNGRVINDGSRWYEGFLFWHHLQLAGLITGEFTGVRSSGGNNHHIIGESAPASKFGNAGWSVLSWSSGDTFVYDLEYGNMYGFGGQTTTNYPHAPILTPEDAWNIDTKVDDGQPAKGNLIIRYWDDACAAADDGTHANNDYVASYKLGDDTVQCALYFRDAF